VSHTFIQGSGTTDALIANKEYDSDDIQRFAEENSMHPHIPPPRVNREAEHPYDE